LGFGSFFFAHLFRLTNPALADYQWIYLLALDAGEVL